MPISSIFYLGKATFLFSHESQWFCLFTHKQAFAAGVRRTYTIPTCGAQRPFADDFALQLHWSDAERTTAKTPICAGTKEDSWTFFVKADVLFWKRSSFVYLEESVRVPSFVPSPLRHRCRSWRLMFLKLVSGLPYHPTLKNDSHEAWKCSVTRKKYFERPHTAVFKRQRLGTRPSTQIFKQDDSFGAKRRRLLLWSVREHLIRVVQRSAFVSTDKLWLSRLSFFRMDYGNLVQSYGKVVTVFSCSYYKCSCICQLSVVIDLLLRWFLHSVFYKGLLEFFVFFVLSLHWKI